MTKVIIGLGNPWNEYHNTPHNAGSFAVTHVSVKCKIELTRQGDCSVGTGDFHGCPLTLIRTEGDMNQAGSALEQFSNIFVGCDTQDIWVVHDDIDLPLGRVAVRVGRSSHGHQGVRSLAGTISKPFVHLLLGVGRPRAMTVWDYVVHPFEPDQLRILHDCMPFAYDVLDAGLNCGVDAAKLLCIKQQGR